MQSYIPKNLVKYNLPLLQNFKFEDYKYSTIQELEKKSNHFIKTFNSKPANQLDNKEIIPIIKYLYNLTSLAAVKEELGLTGILKLSSLIKLRNYQEDEIVFKIGN